MDRLTRKDLKSDKFVAEVGHTVEFLEEHRRQAYIAGGAVLAVVLAVAGFYYWGRYQHTQRQQVLREAIRSFDAPVGEGGSPYILTYRTEEEKSEAAGKRFQEVIQKFRGSDEAAISTYYLGVAAVTRGDSAEAEKRFKEVVESGRQPYASQAAFSLAQLYDGQGKQADAEKLLRDLIAKPTILVSKEQATIALGQILARGNPAEARKLLEPLRTERSAVSRAAMSVLASIPQR